MSLGFDKSEKTTEKKMYTLTEQKFKRSAFEVYLQKSGETVGETSAVQLFTSRYVQSTLCECM